MNEAAIQRLIPQFLKEYDAKSKDLIWEQQSAAFRRFWSERVMTPTSAALSDEDCDQVIRILDRHGKGNTRHCEAVARAMVAQGAWRRMFRAFRENAALAKLVDAILK